MLIQNNIKLLGNITLDKIYRISEWPVQGTSNKFESYKTTVGAIGNMILPFKEHGINVFIEGTIGKDENGDFIEKYLINEQVDYLLHRFNLPTSHALILSNLQDRERTSFVKWGCGTSLFIPSKNDAYWCHILYLDVLDKIDLQSIRKTSKIISADLCLSKPSKEELQKVIEQLSFIDYLFISESEITSIIPDIQTAPLFLKNTGLKNLIYHTREKTCIINELGSIEVINNEPIIENVDVLGAGDIYCANFISHQLKYGSNLQEAALYAHQQTTKFIWIRNEKV